MMSASTAMASRTGLARKEVIQLAKSRRYLPNLIALAVILASYAGGLALLLTESLWQELVAVPVLTLAMVQSWYLTHECAHEIVTGNRRLDSALGELLSWFNGFSYFRFSEYAWDHRRHHAKQVDLIGIDVAHMLAGMSRPVRAVVLALESAHLPVLHPLLRWKQRIDILRGNDNRYRARVVGVYCARTGLLIWMGITSPLALVLYTLAVILRIHVVRFVDAFQHSYPEITPDVDDPPNGRQFEQEHTFSFPVAYRYRFLNLLILNFGFHNAHHAIPTCPWYHLPSLHARLFAPQPGQRSWAPPKAGFGQLVSAYHRHRLNRLDSAGQGHARTDDGTFSLERFHGAFTDKLLG